MNKSLNQNILDESNVPHGLQDKPFSKTQKKQLMHSLQALGKRLISLKREEHEKLGLSNHLTLAISDYLKIHSNSALRRQLQYIGRLMRELENDQLLIIKNYFAIKDGENAAFQAYLKRLEQQRERLLANDQALTEYLSLHPQAQTACSHTIIRNARKELSQNKFLKAYRKLLRLLKEIEPFET